MILLLLTWTVQASAAWMMMNNVAETDARFIEAENYMTALRRKDR